MGVGSPCFYQLNSTNFSRRAQGVLCVCRGTFLLQHFPYSFSYHLLLREKSFTAVTQMRRLPCIVVLSTISDWVFVTGAHQAPWQLTSSAMLFFHVQCAIRLLTISFEFYAMLLFTVVIVHGMQRCAVSVVCWLEWSPPDHCHNQSNVDYLGFKDEDFVYGGKGGCSWSSTLCAFYWPGKSGYFLNGCLALHCTTKLWYCYT